MPNSLKPSLHTLLETAVFPVISMHFLLEFGGEVCSWPVYSYQSLYQAQPAYLHGQHLTRLAFFNDIFYLFTLYQDEKLNVYNIPQPKKKAYLDSDAPGEGLDEGTIVIVSAKRLPHAQAHIDGLLVAGVLVGDNGLARDAVVRHGDGLSAQLVGLVAGAVGVKVVRGQRDQGSVLGRIFEVSRDAAGARLAEDGVAVGIGAELEDGAGRVAAGDGRGAGFNIARGGGGDGNGHDGCENGELHIGKKRTG